MIEPEENPLPADFDLEALKAEIASRGMLRPHERVDALARAVFDARLAEGERLRSQHSHPLKDDGDGRILRVEGCVRCRYLDQIEEHRRNKDAQDGQRLQKQQREFWIGTTVAVAVIVAWMLISIL